MLNCRSFALALALACSTGTAAARPPFLLCSDMRNNSFRIEIDYEEGWGTFEDETRFFEFCAPRTPCLTFPILIGVPPRMPSAREPVVRWRVGANRFAIAAIRGSPGLYMLESIEPGRRGPIRYSGRYSASRGLLTWSSPPFFAADWSRCGGRLTFADVTWLSRHPDIGRIRHPPTRPRSR